MKVPFSCIVLVFLQLNLYGQFAPAAGVTGSSAIYKDSSIIVNWANGCWVQRGYMDISNPALGYASVGDSSMVLGAALTNGIVSLGDKGTAICTFQNPIKNGNGYDFAVFENSFDDFFLELAFVEVSSNGNDYVRFDATCLTDTSSQLGSFGLSNATQLNNLAGKYRGGYGTPFDLQELAGNPSLNIDSITHIKIIDVVGSLNKFYASYDIGNRKINDPYPTPFPSGGFDLDAIAVIHENTQTGINEKISKQTYRAFPNPCLNCDEIKITTISTNEIITLLDYSGNKIIACANNKIDVNSLASGVYFLQIQTKTNIEMMKVILINER